MKAVSKAIKENNNTAHEMKIMHLEMEGENNEKWKK